MQSCGQSAGKINRMTEDITQGNEALEDVIKTLQKLKDSYERNADVQSYINMGSEHPDWDPDQFDRHEVELERKPQVREWLKVKKALGVLKGEIPSND